MLSEDLPERVQAKPRDGLQAMGVGVGGQDTNKKNSLWKPKKKPNTELSSAQTCQKENDCPEQADLLCTHTYLWKMESTVIEFGTKGNFSSKLYAEIWVSPPSVNCLHFPTRSRSCSLITTKILPLTNLDKGFPSGSAINSPPANAGNTRDQGLIPRSGRSPGGGHGNPGESPWTEEPGGLPPLGLHSRTRLKWLSSSSSVSATCHS